MRSFQSPKPDQTCVIYLMCALCISKSLRSVVMGCTPSKSNVTYSHVRVSRDLDTCSTFVPSVKSSVSTPERPSPQLCVETSSGKQTFLSGKKPFEIERYTVLLRLQIVGCCCGFSEIVVSYASCSSNSRLLRALRESAQQPGRVEYGEHRQSVRFGSTMRADELCWQRFWGRLRSIQH